MPHTPRSLEDTEHTAHIHSLTGRTLSLSPLDRLHNDTGLHSPSATALSAHSLPLPSALSLPLPSLLPHAYEPPPPSASNAGVGGFGQY
mmetsp:Transcript_33668/g.108214  ORF Transcript_33668/g.108214 Transcript_33668/m.108214 type:complete len:89 (-) Transcript_33668:785-1051(-)